MKIKRHRKSTSQALTEAHVGSLEQEAVRLKAEILRKQLHVVLMKVITEFLKGVLNHQAVSINWLTQEIEKNPGIAGFNDWKNSKLARLAAKHGNGDTDTCEEADSFAVWATQQELKARGHAWDNIQTDPELALLVVHRLIEYREARLRWYILFLVKECPDADHQDCELRAAAWAGFQLRNGNIDDPEVKRWLHKISEDEKAIRQWPSNFSKEQKDYSRRLAGYFRRAFDKQKRAKWKQPGLDSWLILIWPLVKAEKWNYATVHYLAEMKFPEFNGKPMRSADAMGAHCKLTLGLKITNPKFGAPRRCQFDLENPPPLCRFAMRVGDSFPDFSSFPKMK